MGWVLHWGHHSGLPMGLACIPPSCAGTGSDTARVRDPLAAVTLTLPRTAVSVPPELLRTSLLWDLLWGAWVCPLFNFLREGAPASCCLFNSDFPHHVHENADQDHPFLRHKIQFSPTVSSWNAEYLRYEKLKTQIHENWEAAFCSGPQFLHFFAKKLKVGDYLGTTPPSTVTVSFSLGLTAQCFGSWTDLSLAKRINWLSEPTCIWPAQKSHQLFFNCLQTTVIHTVQKFTLQVVKMLWGLVGK